MNAGLLYVYGENIYENLTLSIYLSNSTHVMSILQSKLSLPILPASR